MLDGSGKINFNRMMRPLYTTPPTTPSPKRYWLKCEYSIIPLFERWLSYPVFEL